MIVMALQGGLGNLLFQISTAVSLGIDNAADVFFINHQQNFDFIKLYHNSNVDCFKETFLKEVEMLNPPLTHQPQIHHKYDVEYHKLPYKTGCTNVYEGYFQSEKFFNHNDRKLKQLYSAGPEMIQEIKKNHPYLFNERCVSMHVRRGDYERFPNRHPILELSYYKNALDFFVDYDRVILFTNDRRWCEQNFVSEKYLIVDETDCVSLYIMSLCKMHIIANSTFSWWGAKLAELLTYGQSVSVICPQKWFGPEVHQSSENICPIRWIKI